MKEKIANILDTFAREELGNRLSQFSLMSLRGMILNEIDTYIAEQAAKKQKRPAEGLSEGVRKEDVDPKGTEVKE